MNLVKSIVSLENEIKKLDQAHLPEWDGLLGDLYVRQLFIPKGVALTSRVYKKSYVDLMISGKITITDSNGTYDLEGFNLLEGVPGRKRAGFAHEDTLWITVHSPEDVKESPKEDISLETIDQYLEYKKEQDNKDFNLFLEQYEITEEQIQEEMKYPVKITGDFKIKKSNIHGKGVFSGRRYNKGELIGPTLDDGIKTELGRFVNHSEYANCAIIEDKLYCLRTLDTGHEFTVNYRESPRLKGAL